MRDERHRNPSGRRVASDAARVGQIAVQAPRLADTMARYLAQAGTFLAPRSVDVADNTLRQLARWLVAHTDITAVGEIGRDDIEDFKVWLAAQPGNNGAGLSANTQRQRLRMLRVFFERIIEWDWPFSSTPTRAAKRDLLSAMSSSALTGYPTCPDRDDLPTAISRQANTSPEPGRVSGSRWSLRQSRGSLHLDRNERSATPR